MQHVQLNNLSAVIEMKKGEMQTTTGGVVLLPVKSRILTLGTVFASRKKQKPPVKVVKCRFDLKAGVLICTITTIPQLA
jgi:hypothetical protein